MNRILKSFSAMFVMVLALAAAGCATSRSQQPDIDALNARMSALQDQLSARDSEVSRLQNELNQQQAALANSENDRRALEARLDSEMEAKKKAASSKIDSDLK